MKVTISNALIQHGCLGGWSDIEFPAEQTLARLVLGQGRASLSAEHEQPHDLLMRVFVQRVRIQAFSGKSERRLEAAVSLIMICQCRENLLDAAG